MQVPVFGVRNYKDFLKLQELKSWNKYEEKEELWHRTLSDRDCSRLHQMRGEVFNISNGFPWKGFKYDDFVCIGNGNKVVPPQGLWPNILDVAEVAAEIQQIMIKNHGAKGLRIHAVYREKPADGCKHHEENRAIDLELYGSDVALGEAFYREAALFWWRFGDFYKMGLGFFCLEGQLGGTRIHIDVGAREHKDAWQVQNGTCTYALTLKEVLAKEGKKIVRIVHQDD